MKLRTKATLEDHVKISKTIGEDGAFKLYLALSRDSYPLGLGRIAAVCLHVLLCDRRIFSRFELDRAVQWPADRKLGFGAVLEEIGWARQKTASMVELDLPMVLKPTKPYRNPAMQKSVHGRNEGGQFVSKEAIEARAMTKLGRRVVMISMDGELVDGILSPDTPQPKTVRRAKNGPGAHTDRGRPDQDA